MRDKGFKLDGFNRLKEESADDLDELPEPEELAADALADLKAAFADVEDVLKLLETEAAG